MYYIIVYIIIYNIIYHIILYIGYLYIIMCKIRLRIHFRIYNIYFTCQIWVAFLEISRKWVYLWVGRVGAFIEQICASQWIFCLTVPHKHFEFLNKIIIAWVHLCTVRSDAGEGHWHSQSLQSVQYGRHNKDLIAAAFRPRLGARAPILYNFRRNPFVHTLKFWREK